MDKGYVTVCPKCGSTDIKAETSPAYAITGLINQYRQCMNCGHHGQFFPEELKSDVRKSPKKASEIPEKTLVETSFGKGYSKYVLYIAIPTSIIAILFILLMLSL